MFWVVLCFCYFIQENNYLFLPARQSYKWEVISLGFLDSLFKKKVEGKTAEEWYALGVRNLKGLEFVVLKRYEEAIASFNKALEIRPSYPEARYNKEDAETELRKIRASKAKAEEKEETTVERTEV